MLFRDGKPTRSTEPAPLNAEFSPEVLRYLIEGISAKVTDNMKSQQPLTPQQLQALALPEDADSSETLQRLAQAMTVSSKIEGKNFEDLGEVKKVESDPDKSKKTLDLLKDIK